MPRPIAVPMNNRKNRTRPHLKTQLGFGLSGGVLVGLIGGAELAQAQTQPQSLTHTGAVYTPLDVLSAEPLEDGGMRVATREGWSTLADGEWALADGKVLIREDVTLDVVQALPWSQISYMVGGASLAGGAAIASYRLMSADVDDPALAAVTSDEDAGSEPEQSADTNDSGGSEGAHAQEEPAQNEVENQALADPEVDVIEYGSYFTGDTLVDSLLSESQEHWAGAGNFNQPTTVTYSFADTGSALSKEQGVDVQSVPESFRALVREQLDGIEAVANVTFEEVEDTGAFDSETGEGRGQINIALADDQLSASFAVLPAGEEPWSDDRNGDIVFDASMLDEGLWVDSYRGGAMTITHEVLHALGLEHPFAGYMVAPEHVDTQYYSLLSYTSSHTDTYYPDAPMIADIAAIQHLYGANEATNAGDDIYQFDSQAVFLGTIWDAGGEDTIRQTGERDAVINLNPGQHSRVGASPTHSDVYSVETIGFSDTDTISHIVLDDETDGWAEIHEDNQAFRLVHDPDTSNLDGDGLLSFAVYTQGGTFDRYVVDNHDVEVGLRENLHIAQGVMIENAHGGQGDDVLVGNHGDNRLNGGAGDDLLTGGAGADVFVFDPGFDDDTISDFDVNEDRLDLSGMIIDSAELVGADTVIRITGEGTITFNDIDVTAFIGTDDFLI